MICTLSTPTNTMLSVNNEPMECPPERTPRDSSYWRGYEPHDLEREYEGPPGDLSLLSHEPQPLGRRTRSHAHRTSPHHIRVYEYP